MQKSKKIFLVEDDPAISDIYKTLMEKSHFNVEVFSLGQEAINRIKSLKSGDEKPDLILLDLILPDINGAEVLKEIRNNNITLETKVFVLTNQDNVHFDQIKPDKIITKANVTPTQLIEIIKSSI